MDFMDKLPLNGSKTYLLVIIAAVLLGFRELGYIDPTVVELALQWLGVGAVATLGHKADKIIKS